MKWVTGTEAAKSLFEVAQHIHNSSQVNEQIKTILIQHLKKQAELAIEIGEAQLNYEAWVARTFVSLFKKDRG